jgi:hypothetical protein
MRIPVIHFSQSRVLRNARELSHEVGSGRIRLHYTVPLEY